MSDTNTAPIPEYTKYDLNKEIFSMMEGEPFWAALSREVDKNPNERIPTAAIRINPNTHTYEMIYNPKWFGSLTFLERKAIVRHEFLHATLQHVNGTRFEKFTDSAEERLMHNMAMDLAINSHLTDLPKGALIPSEGPFEGFPKGLTTEQYLILLEQEKEQWKDKMPDFDQMVEKLKQRMENGGGADQESGQGDHATIDVHDFFDDENVPESVKQIAEQRLKEAMKRAATEANAKGWGSIPADMKEHILSMVEGKLDWRGLLRYFIKTSRRADKKHTVRRINKRYPKIHAGTKVRRVAKIAVSIDQSGSVSDNLLTKFYSELNLLSKYATFTMVPFDCEVDTDHIYEWKQGKRETPKRYRSGGTNFSAPTQWVNDEGDFDGHIVCTDMCAEKPIRSNPKRMWITDKSGKESQPFQTDELVVVID
jgi:predicted metal-dependent peptidase